MASSQPWATLSIALPSGRIELTELAEAADRLESLGALLAADEQVGGVETRDPSTGSSAPGFVATERPELVVYTTPDALEHVRERAARLCDLLQLHCRFAAEVREDDDWRDRWKDYHLPRIFGEGTMIVRPSWVARREGDPKLELVLDPGRAFGTGLHESTSLCQEYVIALAEAGASPSRVLDLGCGSGILGLMAARLFPAAEVTAIDIDPEAVETARENAVANRLEARVDCRTAGIDEATTAQHDLIFANIRPAVLIPGAATIAARAAPGGDLLLSGILEDESDEVARPYLALGLRLVERRELGGWVALHFRAPHPTTDPR